MNVIFNLFDAIIYRGVCCWLKELTASNGYEQLLKGLKEERYSVPPLYDVNFPKGLALKRAFLTRLIENEGRRFLNGLHREINHAFNECERSFFANEALNVLEQKLERTALLMSDHQADVLNDHRFEVALIGHHRNRPHLVVQEAVQHHVFRPGSDVVVASNNDVIYVLHLLKGQLMRLYLEVQEQYKEYVGRNVLMLEDLHWDFFREAVPETCCVVKVDRVRVDKVDRCGQLDRGGRVNEGFVGERKVGKIMVDRLVQDRLVVDCLEEYGLVEDGVVMDELVVDETVVHEAEVGYEGKEFEPVMGDVRPLVKGVLGYGDIVAHQAKFAKLEVELFDHEMIDTNYRFKKKPHGNVMKMAAVYWVAFQKGYFHKYYFKEKRRIAVTAHDVRLFLNHRYQTNIERQFQNFGHEDVLQNYLEREVWISLVDRF